MWICSRYKFTQIGTTNVLGSLLKNKFCPLNGPLQGTVSKMFYAREGLLFMVINRTALIN